MDLNTLCAPYAYVTKLGRYHKIIEYRDTNLEMISISDRFGFNQNIDISRHCLNIAISRCISEMRHLAPHRFGVKPEE